MSRHFELRDFDRKSRVGPNDGKKKSLPWAQETRWKERKAHRLRAALSYFIKEWMERRSDEERSRRRLMRMFWR